MARVNPQCDLNLKFLVVGDADVGKQEFLRDLPQRTLSQPGGPTTTLVLLDGKPVSIQLWDTAGQGRFINTFRNEARGAHGVLIMYDITNKWSFDSVKGWLREIDDQLIGLPRVLIGNRLHLEFNRAVSVREAEHFAEKHNMDYYEVSSIAGFNVPECLTQLSRLVMRRLGVKTIRRVNGVSSLQDLCSRTIMLHIKSVHMIDKLPIPVFLHKEVRSFADGSHVARSSLKRKKGKPKNPFVEAGMEFIRSVEITVKRVANGCTII